MSEGFFLGTKNRVLHILARLAPGATTWRVTLHRWRGVHIGKDVWIGYDAIIETSCPHLVTIKDRAVVGMRATIIAHMRESRSVTIEEDAIVGPGAIVLPNVTIGCGSIVTAGVYRASSIAVAEAAKVIENTQRDLNIALMNELAQKTLSDGEFERIVNVMFPKPDEKASEEQREAIARKRAALLTVYMTSPTVQNVRGTQYGALQAVTEWYDHVKNSQRKKGTREAIERKSEDILIGGGVEFKDRALALITAKGGR